MAISLITGGAGFIGSHVVRYCLCLDHKVIVLDDLSGGVEKNIPVGVTFIKGSIEDVFLLRTIFEKYKIDYVYHLAAYAAEGLSHFIRNFNYSNNLLGSVNLINFSVEYKIKCFVFTSSIAVYGSNQSPMDEMMIPEPEDPYGIAKYAVEMDLKSAQKLFGLNYIIFRPHNVYGENQNLADKYRNVIGIFMNQIMKDDRLTVFGDGEQTRAFSYIDDVAPIIARSVNVESAYNQIFNIGANKPSSIKDLIKIISKEFDTSPKIMFLPARVEVLHAFSSHKKLTQYFDFNANVDISEGIKRMASWAKIEGSKQSKSFSNIEIKENIPSIWLD